MENFQVLGRFTGTDGALPGTKPASALTKGPESALFGVTKAGGEGDFGTVFRVKPGGSVEHLGSFTGLKGKLPGANPTARLVARGDVLFGACLEGGSYNSGTLFVIRPPGRVAHLLTYTATEGPLPGCAPNSLAVGVDGHVYGTTGSNNYLPYELNPLAIHGSIFRLNITDTPGPDDDRLELPVIRVDLLANDGFGSTQPTAEITTVTQTAHGVVTLHNDGTVTYQPDDTFLGTDTFTYTVASRSAQLGSATVTVVDTVAPTITSHSEVRLIPTGNQAAATLPDLASTVQVDDASGYALVTQTPPPGTLLAPAAYYPVVLHAVDRAGNSRDYTLSVGAYDDAPPVFTQTPADRTIVRANGEPQPPCPDLAAQTVATDNVVVRSLLQDPPAGTPLPYGVTKITITASDGRSETRHEVFLRVIPTSELVGATGDIAPGFMEEHRYVSFGSPALGPDGTLAYTALLKSASGSMRTAVFRRLPGASPIPIAGEDSFAGDDSVFQSFSDPVVDSSGTVKFKAKAKPANGEAFTGIWSVAVDALPELIATSRKSPVFRDFKDVSALEDGTLLVHAMEAGENGATQRSLWIVTNGVWKLVLRTGELLTVDGKSSALRDFGYGKVLRRVGGQTRSFNNSGQLALRLKLANERVLIARVSVADDDEVVVEPVAKVGSGSTDWLRLGYPAIGENGDIAFLGVVKLAGNKHASAIGRVAAGESISRLIYTDVGSTGPWKNLGDPIVTAAGKVLFHAKVHSAKPQFGIAGWSPDDLSGGVFGAVSSEIVNGHVIENIRRFDRFAATADSTFLQPQFSRSENSPLRRGVVVATTITGLLQAEGETPLTAPESEEFVTRVDFLTPVPGVGGQTRGINAADQAAFRIKLSSGRSAICVTNP
jgi:uncharacterized repeat protein (TIGR03803 family)